MRTNITSVSGIVMVIYLLITQMTHLENTFNKLLKDTPLSGAWGVFLLIILITLILCIINKTNLKETFPLKKINLKTIGICIVLALCSTAVSAVCQSITHNFTLTPFEMAEKDNLLSFSVNLSQNDFLTNLLNVVVLPITFEEFICRGLLYSDFKKNGNFISATILSSLLFALMHLNLAQTFYAFFIGIELALIREYSGSLLAPALLHGTYNMITVMDHVILHLPKKYHELIIFGRISLTDPDNPRYPLNLALSILMILMWIIIISKIFIKCKKRETEKKQIIIPAWYFVIFMILFLLMAANTIISG